MRYIITTVTVVALIVGIALGFIVSRALDGSASAAPPPPADTKVREQNLDGSGLIRVHEQGTANVNVTNSSLSVGGTVDVGNLPAVQDVNVLSMPSQPRGDLVSLTFTNSLSQFVDTSDCSHVSILARAPVGIGPLILFASPDGTTRVLRGDPGATIGNNVDGYTTAFAENLPVAEPFLQVYVPTPNPTDGWIWCVR